MEQPNQPSQSVPVGNVCGTCRFARTADEKHIACFGAPPQVILVGQRPAPLGRGMQFQFENIRPVLSKDEAACAVYKLRIELGNFDTSEGHA